MICCARIRPAPILQTDKREVKNVVITGSTNGIGKALARNFLLQGDNVIITSRKSSNVYTTYQEFIKMDGNKGECYPIIADVSSYHDCELLVNRALHKMGHIDIWINNAGVSTFEDFVSMHNGEIDDIVYTNLLGTMYCSHLIIPVFRTQLNKGVLINVEGAGSNGFATPNYSVYGSTKCAITHFTKSLSIENRAYKNVVFCTMSPGMVVTDLLLKNASKRMKEVFNIFSETSDYIAEYLVSKINTVKRNEQIRYLTLNRIFVLLLLSTVRYNRHFDKHGNPK